MVHSEQDADPRRIARWMLIVEGDKEREKTEIAVGFHDTSKMICGNFKFRAQLMIGGFSFPLPSLLSASDQILRITYITDGLVGERAMFVSAVPHHISFQAAYAIAWTLQTTRAVPSAWGMTASTQPRIATDVSRRAMG